MPLHRKPHPKCTSTGRVTARLLLSFLALSTPVAASIQEPNPILPPLLSQPASPTPAGKEHAFTLRHVFHHGDLNRPALHRRHDVPQDESPLWIESDGGIIEEAPKPLVARSTPMRIHRLKDRQPSVVDPMVAAAREYSGVWASQLDAWSMDEIDGPDVSNVETILTFAQMAANAYAPVVDEGDWKDVNGGYNRTDDYGFGWDSDGLRGYLYADEMNSTIVIGVKGTTLAIWDGDGTTTNDKENDNLFFSCCCGQQGNYLYRQVCDCAQGTYTCNVSCLKHSLRKENRYYAAARYLYSNVTALYPDANVWMAGHSLGGSVSAMIGLTYGVPALTFQAVPDALPATRLGLPVPPGVNPDKPAQREYTGAYHFGHNADPIYMGTCNGATASCSYAGYALESACHSGRECVWDVVNKNGTRVSVITHKIIYVIESVIKKWKQAPECNFTPECYDCPLWKEVTGNKTESSTSTTSSSTKTRTRTSTCQTPGWWGCLDETTTTNPVTSTSTTTTTTTSTCKTPGWFGCNDETITMTKPHTSISTPTITETCKTPGWFGCNDPTSTSPVTIPTSTPTCSTPGYIWGCKDATTTTTQSHSITSPPAMPTPTPSSIPSPPPRHNSHCVRRSWLGFCKEWSTNYVWREEI